MDTGGRREGSEGEERRPCLWDLRAWSWAGVAASLVKLLRALQAGF